MAVKGRSSVMVTAMLLAHLVGDYVLQTDRIALWKTKALRGVVVHGLIVIVVTALATLPFAENIWWQGIVVIGGGHLLVDGAHFLAVQHLGWFRDGFSPLARFSLDQIAHLLLIALALHLGGYLVQPAATTELLGGLHNDSIWVYALGYAFVTMPAWVLLKFLVSAIVKNNGPNFAADPHKYVGILERILITTFVAMGQFLLVPLVAAPRLIVEAPRARESSGGSSYVLEMLASLLLAVVVGFLLRLI